MLNKRILVLIFLLVFLPIVGCFPGPSNETPIITSVPITTATVGVAYTYDVNATDPDDDTLTYSLTVNPTGMIINSATGLIKWTPAVKGNYAVVVKVSDGALDITQSFTIVVIAEEGPGWTPTPPAPPAVKLTSIVVVPKTMILFVGETEAIVSVTAHYSDGSTFVIDQQGNDYGNGSSDERIATVSVSHVVTAVAKGTATITVNYEDKTDTIEVTVNPVLLDYIVVDPKPMTLFVGETEAFKVIAHYNFGPTENVTYDCVYVSNDTNIAKVLLVGPSNLQKSVEAVREGIAKITVSYAEGAVTKIDEIIVKVNPVLLTSIVVEPDEMTLFVGEGETIDSVTAYYNFGPEDELEFDECTFTLGPSNVSDVISVSSSGEISALNPGRANVVVTYEGKKDTILVIVSPVAVTGVTLDKTFMMLKAGGATGTLVATVAPADATNKSVTWDSSKPVVATVDDGVVTPLTVGTAVITVETVDGGFTATCRVKVLRVTPEPAPEPVTGVTLKPTTLDLTVGDGPVTLVATIIPANATDKSVTWDSSNDAVATVDAGVVTPLTKGKATITVTTVDGGFTAKCEVVVSPAPLTVGDSYGGGIVAYIDGTGQHGLIAATADQSAIAWSNISVEIGISAEGTAIGTGQANTTAIVNQVDGAITCTSGAAKLCNDLIVGVYDDWFLPSKDELAAMRTNLASTPEDRSLYGFTDYFYWSSSESDAGHAWSQKFWAGTQSEYGNTKGASLWVCAVRAF